MKKTELITIADNEAYLRQISKPVNIKDDDLDQNLLALEKYCQENDVLAMASVQIGIPKRIIYLKNTSLEIVNKLLRNSATTEEKNHNEARILINPVIKKSEGLTEYWENCASCLDNMGLVKRPYKICIEYLDPNGKIHKDTFKGFESTVLSHEMDHLDGILHIDIADQILNMPSEERKVFRQTHDYKIISTEGNYEDLIKENNNKEYKNE